MAEIYQLLPSPAVGVLRLSDNAHIPEDVGNRDWIEYQKWLAVPNVPDAALVVPKPTIIPAGVFFARFTDQERLAVQTACNASAALGVGLVNGLALGQITLNSDALKAWLDGLVSFGAITSGRKTELITP